MPKFKYTAMSVDGSEVTGVADAEDRMSLGTMLLDRNLIVKEANEKKSILQLELTKKKVPRKELMHFSRQLSAFLSAGVNILEAIETIEEETTNKVFKPILLNVASAVRTGSTFAAAASQHPEAFPPVYLGMLESAEMTGQLAEVLDQLSEYIERDLSARKKVVSALTYPGIVALMSVATVVVLAAFVLPRFRDFFDSLDAKLPLPTRMLLTMSGWVSDFWFVFPLMFAAFAGMVVYSIRTERGREIRDTWFLKIPIIGDLITYAILERFCRVLSSMVRAGVPMPDAMQVTADATNNRVYQKALAEAREKMLQGGGLAAPIAETGLFPAAARQMLRVGEETGTLQNQLHGAANYFERELDYKITRFTSLFEPAVIVGMGLVVGFVAIALVTAMYGIFRSVSL